MGKTKSHIKNYLWELAAGLALAVALVLTVQFIQGRIQDNLLAELDARLDAMAARHDAALDTLADDITHRQQAQTEDTRRQLDHLCEAGMLQQTEERA